MPIAALLLAVCSIAAAPSVAVDPSPLPAAPAPPASTFDDDPSLAVPVLTQLKPHGSFVATGDELLRRGYRTLGEALADVGGVVRDRTTLGPRYALRGVPDGMALVVDGVPVVVAGERDLLDVDDAIPLHDVERVEVLRGPAAAMNGIGALTGVVRVTTRKPGLTAAALRLGGAVHAGPLVEGEAAAEASLRAGDVAVRGSAAARRGPAQRWRLRAVPTRFEAIGRAVLPTTKQNVDVAPADDEALVARAALSVDDVLVDGSWSRTLLSSPLSSFSHGLVLDDPETRTREATRLRVLWRRHVGPVHVEAAIVGARTSRVDHVPLYPRGGAFAAGGALDVEVQATTGSALVRADVPIVRDHRVVVGAFGDVARARATTDAVDPVDGERTERLVELPELLGTGSVAVEYQGDFGWGLHATAGVVGEARTAFPPAIAPRVALGWSPSSSLALSTSYAEGTRAPDRYDVLSLAAAVVGGRVVGARPAPELRPERVRQLEVGAMVSPSAGLVLEGGVFGLRHEDALANVADGAFLVPVNLDPRHVVGVEASGRVEAVRGLLTVGTQAAFALTVDGGDLGGDAATIAADAIATPRPDVEAGARARLLLRPGDDAAAGTYATADLFVAYEPHPALRFLGGVRDALGEDAASRDLVELPTASDVAVPGATRSVFVSIEGRL